MKIIHNNYKHSFKSIWVFITKCCCHCWCLLVWLALQIEYSFHFLHLFALGKFSWLFPSSASIVSKRLATSRHKAFKLLYKLWVYLMIYIIVLYTIKLCRGRYCRTDRHTSVFLVIKKPWKKPCHNFRFVSLFCFAFFWNFSIRILIHRTLQASAVRKTTAAITTTTSNLNYLWMPQWTNEQPNEWMDWQK